MRASLISHVILLGVILVVWEAASKLGWLDPALLPPVETVGRTVGALFADPVFVRHAGTTLYRVLLAIVIAVPLAFSTGFLIAEVSRFGRVVNPVIHLGLAIPQSIFLPIFMLVFGIDTLQKVVFGVTHAFFVMTVVTVAAARSIPPTYAFAARSFGASPWQIYLKVYLPAMAPLLIGGVRLALIFDIIGVLGAEMYGSREGLGILLFRWGEEAQVARLAALVLVIAFATILMNELLRAGESRVEHWKVNA